MKPILSSALLALATTTLCCGELHAQNYGGAVLNHDIMLSTDFAALSQTQVFGTARSMAMGGAFTSLGGDISTVTINPAGLGMFSHEVVSFTPMVSISDATTANNPSWVGSSESDFCFANMGATFNFTEYGSGSLIALNGAFTYSRLADYNTKMSFSAAPTAASIIDVFIHQLDGANIYPDSDLSDMEFDNNPYFWPAQAAFNTYLIDPIIENDKFAGWGSNTIADGADIYGSYDVTQRGRTDEYSFAFGGNVGNYLYFGATMGIQEITQSTEYVYQEEYFYDTPNGYANLDYQAEYSYLWQKTRLDGAGFNLKAGLIARPTRALRIGVAYHSPTWYSLTRSYQTSMESNILNNFPGEIEDIGLKVSKSPEFIDSYEYSWRFSTPSKLLVGGSLQLGNFGLMSLDYERQWYSSIRVTNAPGEYTTNDYQLAFENNYKPTNTLRAGIEIKPLPILALRVGAGASDSMLKDEEQFYSSPVPTDSNYVTCGFGIQFTPTTSLDLAYQYYHQNYTPYRLFYVETQDYAISSNLFESQMDRHFITATLTFKL